MFVQSSTILQGLQKLAKESGVSIDNVLKPPPDSLLMDDTENLLHALDNHLLHKTKV